MKRLLALLLLLVLPAIPSFSQTAPTEGLRDNTPSVHAFVHARIVTAPGHVLNNATIVIRDGIIEAVGERVSPPADARIWDMKGLTLYAGLIDLYSDYGVPKAPDRPARGGAARQQEQPAGAAHWNTKARADYDVAEEFKPDAKAAEKLRSQGFTLVQSVPEEGLFRGQAALVNLGEGPVSGTMVERKTASATTFYQQGGFFSGYPNSLMGIIAFTRQTWLDADWYRQAWSSFAKDPSQKRPETNNVLAALSDAVQGRQPVLMEANNELDLLRAAKIGREFSLKLMIRGSGKEFRRLDAVKAERYPIILPVNFPDPPDVSTPEEALNVSLEDLRDWDEAPENPARLQKNGIPFSLTASELKDAGTFLAHVRTAIQRGLSPDAALAALTTTPASWLGLQKQYGTLEKGKAANIVVCEGNLFDEHSKVREVWIDGKRYEVKEPPANDPRGVWNFSMDGSNPLQGSLTVGGDVGKLTGTLGLKGKKLKCSAVSLSAGRLAFTVASDSIGWPGSMVASGSVTGKEMFGVGNLPDGSSFNWSAARKEGPKEKPDTAKAKKVEMASFPDVYPLGAFGRARQPEQPQYVLVKNAKIWTQGKQGTIENADMLIAKGKISRIGKGLSAPKGAVVIDATGKDVSPGLIDCHSHTAISAGINEGGQAVTCEARIQDVLNPDDIWIYRQLAGGTTIANVLHGSANPIGGQNAVVKWRWGGLADDLLLQGAPPGVKFALGENVKRSNFTLPAGTPVRYPASRMGVEQIIRDRFKAAQDYEKDWNEWRKDKSKIPPRRDLELDALVEILHGKRLIHAHSYRQDEILMLIRVAEEFGIRIATFQHVLEGYKVADAMAKHGAGGSTFSDWWAYKIEAWDAIPGNGPLMHKQGVVVSYNSDNNQLASRLNWEAAKAVKYGLSEEEALNFVTLNPARQLKIDDKVGSLEPGKDADFVIWNGDPLSTFTSCEQTWVDGRKYFDVKEDKAMTTEVRHERAVLIQKILSSKKGAAPAPGGRTGARRPSETENYSCIKELINEN